MDRGMLLFALVDMVQSQLVLLVQLYQLTNREVEIIQFIRQGLKYKEIANRLFISERTVSTHVQNAFEKTKSSNKVELLHKLDQLNS